MEKTMRQETRAGDRMDRVHDSHSCRWKDHYSGRRDFAADGTSESSDSEV